MIYRILCALAKGVAIWCRYHEADNRKERAMKKTTAEKLDRQYADLTADGEIRPENMTSEFGDTIRDACDECVSSDFFWLPQICRENASENAQAKVKTLLLTKHGAEAIKSLPAMISTICYREACSEARRSCILKRDPKTGVVAIDKYTGKVIRVPKTISLDWQNEEVEASNRTSIEEPESHTPSPLDELERHDMQHFLRLIDGALTKLPKQKAYVFRLVAYQGCSALDVARIVFHSKVRETDAAKVKKIEQNRIACIVDRVRHKLIETLGYQAFELGVLSKSRMHTR